MAQVYDDITKQHYDALTPRTMILSWLGRIHIDISDEEIEKRLRDRIERSENRDFYISTELANDMIRYALDIREKQRELYISVMTGRF